MLGTQVFQRMGASVARVRLRETHTYRRLAQQVPYTDGLSPACGGDMAMAEHAVDKDKI